MASGPTHYRTAEALIDVLHRKMEEGGPLDRGDMDSTCALAQIHATLAVAAASAMNIRRNGAVEDADAAAGWERVLGGSS